MTVTPLFEQQILISNLVRFKNEKKLTYEQIGDRTNMDKSGVYKIFKGITSPSIDFLARFAQLIEIPIYSLFIPGNETLRQYYAERINKRMQELELTIEEIAAQSQCSILRLKDIYSARVTPSPEEMFSIDGILGLEAEKAYSFEHKFNLFKELLRDYGLNMEQTNNILEYITSNKK